MEFIAFVNAVLGGFAFVFLGALISIDNSSRVLKATFLGAAMAAGCFLVATLGSTLTANLVEAFRNGDITEERLDQIQHLRRPISMAFLWGVLFLIGSLGLIGWIKSRNLGIATTLIAVLTGLGAVYVIRPFIN